MLAGVVVDQVCFAPPAHVAYFAWISSSSSGFTRSLSDVSSDVRARLWPALKASVAVWPAAIYVNLAFVALPYRVLFVNVIGMGYGMMLSYMANRELQLAAAPSTLS